MKILLLCSIFLMSQLSVASAAVTSEYNADFHSRYSDSRGKDKSCSVNVIDGKDLVIPQDGVKIIRIEAVGTGRWIDLEIPSNRLPLAEGDDFVVESVTGNKRITYSNGVLSYHIDDLDDKSNIYYKHGVADLKIKGNLTSVKLVGAQEVSLEKTISGKIRMTALMSLKCKF